MEIARDIVTNGDIVNFGDLGTLEPSFKSKAVEDWQTFPCAGTHREACGAAQSVEEILHAYRRDL